MIVETHTYTQREIVLECVLKNESTVNDYSAKPRNLSNSQRNSSQRNSTTHLFKASVFEPLANKIHTTIVLCV